MAWSVSAQPERYDEAIDWLSSRVPYTREQFDALDDRARRQAFYISGGVELEAVQTILDELKRNVEKGEPFETFQVRVRTKLIDKVGPDGFHLETVYRNAVQASYNAGRWQQLTDPEMTLLRPFFLFDAVLDDRTTTVCRECDGIVKAHDDPFWLTHSPALHHRCRSTLRSLRTSEARRRGITVGEPAAQVPEGWGQAPSLKSDDTLKPKRERFDPELWAEFTKRDALAAIELEDAQRAEAERRTREQQKDPAHWVSAYEAKYGQDVARKIGWGRAMVERASDLAHTEFAAAYDKVAAEAALAPLSENDRLVIAEYARRRAEKVGAAAASVTMRDVIDEVRVVDFDDIYARKLECHMAVLGHAQSVTPGTGYATDFASVSKRVKAPTIAAKVDAKARGFYERMSQNGTRLRWHTIQVDRKAKRASFSWDPSRDTGVYNRGDNRDVGTAVHELGHAWEFWNGSADLSRRFVLARADSPSLERLSAMTGRAYKATELAYSDDFWSHYVGKAYRGKVVGTQYVPDPDSWYASEVVSMTTEAMVSDLAPLGSRDTDTLLFVLGLLAGGAVP